MSRHTQDLEVADIDKSYVDNIEVIANANKPNPRKEAPAYVAGLSPEERAAAEKALVRKIDIRLLPMIIVMYILNYLDRNNIVGRLGTIAVLVTCLILFSRLRLVSLGWRTIWASLVTSTWYARLHISLIRWYCANFYHRPALVSCLWDIC